MEYETVGTTIIAYGQSVAETDLAVGMVVTVEGSRPLNQLGVRLSLHRPPG